MADSNYNSMQMNMGLWPGGSPVPSIRTPSPSETALNLSNQASQQLSVATQMHTLGSPAAQAAGFGQQFQAQLSQIQQSQSMNPYVASMLQKSLQQGGAPAMLPSPMMMTPPESGIFRPPTAPAAFAPMAPMPTMPQFTTPFTPQMPQPQFRTAWEQESIQREQRGDQLYSNIMQAPRVAGTAVGLGVGALMGAGMGSRFGPAGAVAGAVGGALLAGASGAAQGMGSMAMAPAQPFMAARQMGASAQRMSQNWVMSGPDLHPMGRGLSQQGGQELGRGIQQMAGSQEFKAQTGGMFNRGDLMRMTSMAGDTGLMDMEQSVPQIKAQLRRVSRTVSAFMQLTNDPDVTSVIRQMSQLRGMGMSMPEIESSAYQMKAYARAAGTSIGGIQAQGGLPGAATFQQAGLSPAAGFGYGMHAMSSARQAVASGTFSPMQLALQGGVHGVAQRNMQAQAAYMGTPLFAASVGSFQGGNWQMDPNKLSGQYSQGGGAQGMAMGAIRNLGQAVQEGGIGALANFGLMQKEISSTAAQVMTPGEMNLMRFRGAMNTGKMLGMKGADALSLGAQAMYGPDIARQMMLEASNPDYWKAQQQQADRGLQELGGQQYADIKARAPGFWDKMKNSGAGRMLRDVGGAIAAPFRGAAGGISDVASDVGEWMDDEEAWEQGRMITRRDRGRDVTERKAAEFLSKNYKSITGGRAGGSTRQVDAEISNRDLARAGEAMGGMSGGIGDVLSLAAGLPYGEALGQWAFGGAVGGALDEGQKRNVLAVAQQERERVVGMFGAGKKRAKASIKEQVDVLSKIGAKSGRKGKDSSKGYQALNVASQAYASMVQSRAGTFTNDRITSEDFEKAAMQGMASIGISEKEWRAMDPETRNKFLGDMRNAARASSHDTAMFDEVEADSEVASVLELNKTGEDNREARMEDYDTEIDAVERKLGLSNAWYKGGDVAGLKDLEKFMQKTSKFEIQAMAAAAGGTYDQEAMETMFEKEKGAGTVKDQDFASFMLRMKGKLKGDVGEDVRKALRKAGSKGMGGIRDVGEMAGLVQGRAVSGAMAGTVADILGEGAGAGFQSRMEGYEDLGAEGIIDSLRQSMKGAGSSQSPTDFLRKLAESGSGKQKKLAKDLLRYTEGGAQSADVMSGISITPEELLSEKSAYEATGTEADRLKREKKAAQAGEDEFGEVVRNKFKPAADSLLKAAQAFAKAEEARAAGKNLS